MSDRSNEDMLRAIAARFPSGMERQSPEELAIADRERARLVAWLRRMAREELIGERAAGVAYAAEALYGLLPADLRAELDGEEER